MSRDVVRGIAFNQSNGFVCVNSGIFSRYNVNRCKNDIRYMVGYMNELLKLMFPLGLMTFGGVYAHYAEMQLRSDYYSLSVFSADATRAADLMSTLQLVIFIMVVLIVVLTSWLVNTQNKRVD
jgi:hypothetical protein